MDIEKYTSEIAILTRYFDYFCKTNHQNQTVHEFLHTYKNINFTEHFTLCPQCFEDISYSINRLQNCPHEIKPRCRHCKAPCYEKVYWKRLAKVMIYSSIRLKVENFLTKFK